MVQSNPRQWNGLPETAGGSGLGPAGAELTRRFRSRICESSSRLSSISFRKPTRSAMIKPLHLSPQRGKATTASRGSLRSMKRRWSKYQENQLMGDVRDHRLRDEVFKLTKKYPANFDKTIQRLQITVVQRREKTDREIRATSVYILDDFKRACSDELVCLPASSRRELHGVGLVV